MSYTFLMERTATMSGRSSFLEDRLELVKLKSMTVLCFSLQYSRSNSQLVG
jgi:hypothetical protein